MIFLVSPKRNHNWRTVKLPTQAIVNKPTHFTLTVAPRPKPVIVSQNHQLGENALEMPCSWMLRNEVQASAVAAVKLTNGESKRIRRDCVKSPFSSGTCQSIHHISASLNFLLTKYNKSGAQKR